MKLGFMQPYFFPYVGYFELIYRTDCWIVFDTAQYIRHGWVNRNRILHPEKGWQYIIVPVNQSSRSTRICDIHVVENNQWWPKIIGQLQHYRNHAPFFKPVVDIVAECITDCSRALNDINVNSLTRVCEYLGVPFKPLMLSEMNINLGPIESPGDWALRMAEAIGADEYINPSGGADLFDPTQFKASGIQLTIQRPIIFEYDCAKYKYEPNLSIVDVMMWNSPETIRSFLESRSQEE